ncbi:acyltransferase [Fictibacillus arsenicus]|uniref:Transferase n=1 Tax=Fictibacillus arsenicus TaxID=255247 RepID=A0A1V3GC71_9BACL|nr:acyltransferase [Fictibacillus arsenicus]OOE14444.1 transferase [Fictibacillus arsenicus]
MHKAINKIISTVKKDNFEIDKDIYFLDILSIIFKRILMMLKGLLKSFGMKNKSGIVFFGSNVTLYHKRLISLGRSVTLEESVEIDALSKNGVKLGNNVRIGAFSKIKCSGTIRNLGKGLTIGKNSGCGEFSYFGAAGGISIGENVIMGQNIRFHSENHVFDRLDIPIKEQGVTNQGIKIGNDCWIGAGSVFLDGVTIGEGCVIGANTLVNRDIPAYSVAVGSPVKIIRNRKEILKVK